MATGQVSFHDPKATRKTHVAARQNVVVNRLNKTKREGFPDLQAEKEEKQRQERKVERIAREKTKAEEREQQRERDEKRWQKEHAYDDLMNEDDITASSNQDRDPDFLDDFM